MTMKTANEVLEESKNAFKHVVVVGLHDNGKVDVNPTISTYQFCQWLLDRAKFELLISEKANIDANDLQVIEDAPVVPDHGPANA